MRSAIFSHTRKTKFGSGVTCWRRLDEWQRAGVWEMLHGLLLERLRAVGLPERVIVDASHDNSGKDHERQPGVAADLGAQVAAGNGALVGVMLESFIVAGRQELQDGKALTYGQSITDACMSWETTVEVLEGLAGAVRERRGKG